MVAPSVPESDVIPLVPVRVPVVNWGVEITVVVSKADKDKELSEVMMVYRTSPADTLLAQSIKGKDAAIKTRPRRIVLRIKLIPFRA